MQVGDVLRFTNLLKNLWRLYAIIPDDRKNDVYADICRVESRMSADTYTQFHYKPHKPRSDERTKQRFFQEHCNVLHLFG